MATITAIELGPDTCAFARTAGPRSGIRLLASEILDPAAFPGAEAFTTAVRRTRRAFHLPRRSRIVVWGLPDGASRNDPAVKSFLRPLTDAGFRIERVVTPCNALAALARQKTSRADGSACWIAINRGGVAIVAVRPGKLLYAHSFVWDSTVGAVGSQARLLQRYSLVSYLSPHVKRAMAEARKAGAPVGVVVTCGNLPDLRSLTMPLIEELDVEVETLDSLEGLVVKPEVAEKLAESAPAIRLACAAVIARGSRPWDPSKKKPSRAGAYIAAAAVLAAVLVALAYQWYRSSFPFAPASQSPQTRARLPAAGVSAPPPAAASKAPIVAPASNPPGTPMIEGRDPRTGQARNDPRSPILEPRTPASNPPGTPMIEGRDPRTGQARNDPRSPILEPRTPASNPVGTSMIEGRDPRTGQARNDPRSPILDPRVQATPPKSNPPAVNGLNTPAVPADKPDAGRAARPAAPGNTGAPTGEVPLPDAIPRVTAILVSRDRRHATLEGGRIVGIGDVLGRRTVVGMDERSVLLQEPSGLRIRVGLGGRLLKVDGAAR